MDGSDLILLEPLKNLPIMQSPQPLLNLKAKKQPPHTASHYVVNQLLTGTCNKAFACLLAETKDTPNANSSNHETSASKEEWNISDIKKLFLLFYLFPKPK